MYTEYRKELDKFLDYKGSIDTRTSEFKKNIAEKEKQLEQLKENFTESFISGKGTDDKQLKQLKADIETDKEQLLLIEQATKENKKLKELGNLVFKEYVQLNNKKYEDIGEDNKEIEQLEKELEQKKKEILSKRDDRERIIKEITQLRTKALDYMDIGEGEKSSLALNAKM